jgi:membrane-associated protease RseP (regulator of RpoE activity)
MKTLFIFIAVVALCVVIGTSGAQEKKETVSPPKHKTGEQVKPSKGRSRARAWLGVSIRDVTPRVARERDLSVKSGVLVTDVADDSPAERAGIKEADVIVAFNGKTVDETDDLIDAVRETGPGTEVTVAFIRGTEKKTVSATLDKAPGREFSYFGPMPHIPRMPHIPPIPRIHVFSSCEMLGLSLSDLNTQLGEYFGAPNNRGVLVEEVEKGSAGEKAGFKAGDVITKVGTESVESIRDVDEALEDTKEGEKVDFGVLRKGTAMTLTVPADELSNGKSFRHRLDHEKGMFFRFDQEKFRNDMKSLEEGLRNLGDQIREQMQKMRKTIQREVRNVES